MKQIIQRLFTCLILGVVFGTTAWAQSGPEMNKPFEVVGSSFGNYNPVKIPKEAFISNALSAKIKIVGAAYAAINNDGSYEGNDIDVATYDEAKNKPGVIFNISGTHMNDAINGNIYLRIGGGTSYTIYVTNYATADGAANDTGNTSGGNTGGNDSGDTGSGGSSSGDSGNTDGGNTGVELGFKDLGIGWLFQQQDHAYSYVGDATTMVAGAIVTVTTNSGDLVWYKKKGDYTGYNRGTKSYALTNDDITSLASNNYTLYFATWDSEPITNITLSMPGNTGGGGEGGGSTGMTLAQKIEAKAQLTDVPTLYITVPDALNADGTRKDINSVLFKDFKTLPAVADYHVATIQLVDDSGELTEFTDQVQIKVRGNSTAKEDVKKKPYRLKFAKEIKDKNGTVIANCQKHDMLGKGYSKRNWALLANYLDPAMVRNALTNKIGELVGMPFRPGYKFADVVINGEYRGTYQITDHVEADADRVNVNEDTGWFLESARGDMVEAPSASAQSLMMSIKNPDTDKWTTEQIATLKTQIEDWFKPVDDLFCIYNGTFDLNAFTDPVNGWRKYWNEESLVDFYIGINLTGDYDGFMTVKMYRDLNKKLKFGPLWDKDLAFGNYSADKGTTLAEDQQIGSYFTSYAKKLWLDPVFIKKVHDKLNTLVSNGIVTTLKNNVDELAELTAQTEELNRPLWGIGASWSQSFDTREAAIQQLKDYLDQHIPWFQSTINTQYTKLGGDNIVDNSIPGDDFNDGTTPGEGGGSGNVEIPETSTFEKLNVTDTGYKITASAFNAKATSIEVTFTRTNGTATNVWGFYGYEGSEWDANEIPGSNWNTYKINITKAEDIAAVAKNGIAWRLQNGGGTTGDVTIVVHNIGVPEGGDETDTPDTPAERAQLTNLPTIYLDATVGNEWSGASVQVFDSENKLTQGTEWTNSALEVQYQGSGDKNKDSYRLKFGSKIKLMGANKYKQWVLLANDDDPSMINNALAKELGDAVDMPWTPGYQFVDLYVNDTYMGTYQVTDRVKAEEGRSLVSNGDKNSDWQVRFNDADELREDGTQDYITAINGVNVIYKNPDPKDLTADQVTALRTDMKAYFDDVFTKNTDGTYPNFAENVDKDQLINWYICQEILGVYKGFSSIEAYRSITATATDNLLHFGPLWDSEKAFGNRGEAAAIDMSDKTTADSYLGLMTNYAAYDEMKDLFNYLWTQPWFGSGVRDKWNTLKTAGLLTTLKSKADAISGTLSESQPKNAKKWTGSLGGAENYSATITNIKNYLTTRFDYLDTKFNARAAGLCEHEFAYADNEDGTHKHYCTKCDYTDVESDAHTLTMVSGKAHCSVCGLDVTAEATGNEGEKVYILDAGTSKVQYITKNSGFTPAPNNVYKINEQPEEETVFENVYWLGADGKTNYADKIVVDDSAPWNVNIQIMAKEATHTRSTAAASIWGTVCLPFKTKTNEDVTLFKLSSVSVDEDGKGTMVFEEASSTGGLTPLVFKKKDSSATSVKFTSEAQTDNADPAKNGYATVKATAKMSKNKSATKDPLPSGWEYYGNVQEKQTVNANADGNPALYFISSNKFYRATSTLKVSPFRAYFEYTAPTAEAKIATFMIADDEATKIVSTLNEKNSLAIFTTIGGINIVAPKDMTVNIYTTAGTLAKRIAATANNSQFVALPCGMYVINGAKFVIK